MHYITTHLAKPVQQSSASSSRDRRARSRSIDPDPPITWPGDWSIDKAAFRSALKAFDVATAELSKLLVPSLAGTQEPSDQSEPSTLSQPSTASSTMGDRNQGHQANQGSQGNQSSGHPNPPHLDPALLDAIRQIVRSSVEGIQGRRPDGGGGNGPGNNAAADPASRAGKLRAEDLGYFDPDYESEKNESIVSVGRHVYYRDMFVWIDHLKDLVKNHSEEELRPMVTQAFRGGVLVWYLTELSELEKDLLREATMERWYQAIAKRFKQRGPEAQDALDRCAYTLQDARNGRTPRAYVQDIIRHAKATGLPLYNQLLLAYTKMHPKFRVHLFEPNFNTSLSAFLDMLDSKANAFHDIARDELGSRNTHQQHQLKGKSRQPGQNFPSSSSQQQQQSARQQEVGRQVPFRPFVPSYQGRYYQPQGYQNRPFYSNNNNPQSSQQAPVPNRQQQQQPVGQGYVPQRNGAPRPQPAGFIKQEPGRYPARGFPDNSSYRPRAAAYQGEDEESDPQVEENYGWQQEGQEAEEGFHGNEDLSYYYPRDDHEEDPSYQSEAQAHHGTVSSVAKLDVTCRHCQAKFASKNLLHKHLRSKDCQPHKVRPTKSVELRKASATPEATLYNEDERGGDAARLPFVLGEEVRQPVDAPSDRSERQVEQPSNQSEEQPAEAEEAFRDQPNSSPSNENGNKEGLHNRLVFHVDKATGVRRLCIPDAVVKDVLDIAHTAEGHLGFARCFERVSSSWYIKGLTRYLRDYLKHCPECLVYQTRRHAPYGSMQPIYTPPIPFHTLTIDFILAMPVTPEGFDCAMSVTCKFSKRNTFVPGKTTWTAAEWATALIERLEIGDWGLPKVILSDRDPKFLSELWTSLFEQLKVQLLYSTAYHPQTDGQSERTNQTAEIMLRFFVAGLERPELWPSVLPRLQAIMNSSISAATGKTPNEVIYGFKPNQPLDLVAASSMPELKPPTARISAADALAFANMNAKHYYDKHHTPMFLKEGSLALLRLHKGYNIPANASITKKLGQQYAGPFKVLRKVGNLAYELDIPTHWRVHPVFSIAMLEPMPSGPDPYGRPVPDQPGSIHVEGDTATHKSWAVERIVDKRGDSYLVRWKGWDPSHDQWRSKRQLGNASELIKEYEDRIRDLRNQKAQRLGLRTRKPSAILPIPAASEEAFDKRPSTESRAIAVRIPTQPRP